MVEIVNSIPVIAVEELQLSSEPNRHKAALTPGRVVARASSLSMSHVSSGTWFTVENDQEKRVGIIDQLSPEVQHWSEGTRESHERAKCNSRIRFAAKRSNQIHFRPLHHDRVSDEKQPITYGER